MKRKPYPLRINSDILEAISRWANDDLRSINGQIEFVLREGLIKAGRFKPHSTIAVVEGDDSTLDADASADKDLVNLG